MGKFKSKSMKEALKAAVVDNGIIGLHGQFVSNEAVQYSFLKVTGDFDPDLSLFDLLIVPNGSDHIAMMRIKENVASFLASGKALCCLDGWFTPWIPNNRWVMDNSKKSIELRYFPQTDPQELLKGVDIQQLIFSHGISGWWSCGYIEQAPQACVVLEDTWQRPIIVLDEQSTAGTIFLTASGPLGDGSYATTDDDSSNNALSKLYHNFIQFLQKKKSYV